MQTILTVFQILLAMILIAVILLQQRSQGLSATFGGGGGGIHVAKRGAEKVLFNITLVIAFLFVINSLAFLFI